MFSSVLKRKSQSHRKKVRIQTITTTFCKIYNKQNTKPWFQGLKIPHNVIITVLRARANHTRLNNNLPVQISSAPQNAKADMIIWNSFTPNSLSQISKEQRSTYIDPIQIKFTKINCFPINNITFILYNSQSHTLLPS